MVKRKRSYLSHPLCSSESTQVVVHLGKTKKTRSSDFMAKRANRHFKQMKLGTSVIPHFHVIFTVQSISELFLLIQGYLQGPNVNFSENIIF